MNMLGSSLPVHIFLTYGLRMLRTFVCLSVVILSCLRVSAASQKLVFERGTAIWVSNLDGTNAEQIAKGSGPDISTDGTRVAFHTDESTNKDVTRRIAIVDLATK